MVISHDDQEVVKLLSDQYQVELSLDQIQQDRMLHLKDANYEFVFWILSPEYDRKSIKRRLLRSADLIVLCYSSVNVVGAFDNWMEEYKPTTNLLSVMEPGILDHVTTFHGTLSSASNLRSSINKVVEDKTFEYGVC